MVSEAGLAPKLTGSQKPNLPATHSVCHSLSVIPPKNLANGQVGDASQVLRGCWVQPTRQQQPLCAKEESLFPAPGPKNRQACTFCPQPAGGAHTLLPVGFTPASPGANHGPPRLCLGVAHTRHYRHPPPPLLEPACLTSGAFQLCSCPQQAAPQQRIASNIY